MTVERVAKDKYETLNKLLITPMGRCHISKTFSLFQEHKPNCTIDNFLKLWSNMSPYKLKQYVKQQTTFQEIIIARSTNDYIHGLFTCFADHKKKLIIEHIIIPGPIGRQKVLKQFIEYIIRLGIDLKCSTIKIYDIKENDWYALFLQEAGAKRINPTCLQINLSP